MDAQSAILSRARTSRLTECSICELQFVYPAIDELDFLGRAPHAPEDLARALESELHDGDGTRGDKRCPRLGLNPEPYFS